MQYTYTAVITDISIHAPREGRDATAQVFSLARSKFQSTRPARGATIASQ